MEELHYTAVCHLSYVLENNLQFTEPILKPLEKNLASIFTLLHHLNYLLNI